MARLDQLKSLANKAFELVNEDRERLGIGQKINPNQGISYLSENMGYGPVQYRGFDRDGVHSFSRPLLNIQGGHDSQWSLTSTALTSEIKRCIKAKEPIPRAMALALSSMTIWQREAKSPKPGC